ncbi:hypothetical protein [Hydrogenispora ethanolica]|uniref:hypothetical protein n=1 Tax=Hydrogenispora ethanolica TaxID=1082276 RepID=UPI001404DF14
MNEDRSAVNEGVPCVVPGVPFVNEDRSSVNKELAWMAQGTAAAAAIDPVANQQRALVNQVIAGVVSGPYYQWRFECRNYSSEDYREIHSRHSLYGIPEGIKCRRGCRKSSLAEIQ